MNVTLANSRWFHVPVGDWLDAETTGGRKLAANLATKHLAEVVAWFKEQSSLEARCVLGAERFA